MFTTTSHGRRIKKIDFGALLRGEVGQEKMSMQQEKQDGKSCKSTKSRKLVKSTKTNKSGKDITQKSTTKNKGKNPKEVVDTSAQEDADSRTGDFEDEDIISLGSDASRIGKIDREMEQLAPTWTEKYNEYKCKQGYQQRLEDAELPQDLEDDAVYNETLKLHQEQLIATEDRGRRSKRRLELSKLRQQILDKHEEAQLAETELELQAMRKQYERRKILLEKAKE